MDSKKNKKKIWILSIVTVVLIAVIVTVGVIFGSQKKNSKNNGNSAENMSYTNIINEAIALGKVSKNYNGTYEFSGVRSVTFNKNLTADQITKICQSDEIGGKSINDLIYCLYQNKINELNGRKEILKFSNNDGYGKFTRFGTSLDFGTYVGDENLTLITTLGTNEQIFVSLNYNEINNAYTVNNKESSSIGTKLYLFKKVYSNNNPNLVLFEITYEYTKQISNPSVIPDADLNYNLP